MSKFLIVNDLSGVFELHDDEAKEVRRKDRDRKMFETIQKAEEIRQEKIWDQIKIRQKEIKQLRKLMEG